MWYCIYDAETKAVNDWILKNKSLPFPFEPLSLLWNISVSVSTFFFSPNLFSSYLSRCSGNNHFLLTSWMQAIYLRSSCGVFHHSKMAFWNCFDFYFHQCRTKQQVLLLLFVCWKETLRLSQQEFFTCLKKFRKSVHFA